MNQKIKNIVFDVDGTLLFTSPGIYYCLEFTLKKMGLPVPLEPVLRKCVGPPLTDSFKKRLGVPLDRVDEAMHIYRAEYVRKGEFMCEPYDGLDVTLKGLKEEGYSLFVASSKTETSCQAMLEKVGFAKYFDDICGADFSKNIEKKIEVLTELFRRNPSMKKEESYLVGDTYFDAEGATAFGIDCLGVLYGFGEKKTLIEYGCRAVVEKPADIKLYFDNL